MYYAIYNLLAEQVDTTIGGGRGTMRNRLGWLGGGGSVLREVTGWRSERKATVTEHERMEEEAERWDGLA